MSQEYLDFLVDGMTEMFDGVTNVRDRPLLLAATMTRFLGCASLLDLSQTFEINKDSLYRSVDSMTPDRWYRRLRKKGRIALLKWLKRFACGSPSWRSRHSITLVADDFTRPTRGSGGGISGLFYCGAVGGVVPGINCEVLAAVIGDGIEVILLDVRIVPPEPQGSGRRPATLNEWLRKALAELNAFILGHGSNLKGCFLSVDAAYVSRDNVDTALALGLTMVGKLSINRRVTGKFWMDGIFEAPAGLFAAAGIIFNLDKCRPLRGEDEVHYFRRAVRVHSLKRQVLMTAFITDNDVALYFSTDQQMKVITLRNLIRIRWQLERVFWILKQDIGIGDIHHQKRERVISRIYLQFLMAQVTRDAALHFNCSPKNVLRSIRRNPWRALAAIGIPCAFAPGENSKSVLDHGLAA